MNKPVFLLVLSALMASLATPAFAADSAAIRKAVGDFLQSQVKGLPGKASFVVGTIDADRLAGACKGYDVAMAPGSRPWGNTQVTVQCRGEGWTLQVPVKIRVVADYLVTARPITAGQRLAEADVGRQSGELSDLPTGILMDPDQAVGRVAVASLPAGRPLRGDMLRQPVVVQQGQSVKIIGSGEGFQVSNEGRALTNAAIGQVVQVRLASGQIISGIAQPDGTVEIRF